MKRLMASKSWQPTIVTINENGGGTGTSSAVVDKPSRFPRKMIFDGADVGAVKENGDAVKENDEATLDNGVTVGTLTNNNRTTATLMAPN